MRRLEAAVRGLVFPVAAFALLISICGCGRDSGDGDRMPATRSAIEEASPPVARTAASTPEVPRRSAALADRPPVSAPAPVRLVAPDLGIDVPVEAVGLDDVGRMGLPANPSVAAWYRFGAAPASAAGSTVIAAHVDSLVYDIGPFAKLADAPAGTRFEVTTADGVVRAYALASTEIVPKESVDWSRAFARDGSPRLTLVTCGGEFDDDARRYLSNVLVTATPVG